MLHDVSLTMASSTARTPQLNIKPPEAACLPGHPRSMARCAKILYDTGLTMTSSTAQPASTQYGSMAVWQGAHSCCMVTLTLTSSTAQPAQVCSIARDLKQLARLGIHAVWQGAHSCCTIPV